MLLIDALLLSILTLQSDLLLQKQALCNEGDMDGCAQLAIAYELGYYGAERDLELAAKINQIACDGGVGSACLRLAFAHANGRGVQQNVTRSLELMEKACELGDAPGCENLALHYARGEGVAKDVVRAMDAWQRVCDLGDANRCRNFASALENGRLVPQNLPRAREIHLKACSAKQYSSCLAAARLFRNDASAAMGTARMISLYRKACRDGFNSQEACVELGDMYRDGDRVPRNQRSALALYRQGCDKNFIPACRAARALTDEAAPGVEENLSQKSYLISSRSTIHPSMGPWLFRFFGNDYGWLERIEVFDEAQQRVIQQLQWPTREQEPPQLLKGHPNLSLSDLDFDGYQDIMLRSWWGATGNTGHMVWLFNPGTRHFVINLELSRLSNLTSDPENKRLTTFSKGGHAGMICHSQTIRWVDAQPLVVRDVSQDWNPESNAYVKIIKERRGAELVLVRRETFGKGEIIIEELSDGQLRRISRTDGELDNPTPGCR